MGAGWWLRHSRHCRSLVHPDHVHREPSGKHTTAGMHCSLPDFVQHDISWCCCVVGSLVLVGTHPTRLVLISLCSLLCAPLPPMYGLVGHPGGDGHASCVALGSRWHLSALGRALLGSHDRMCGGSGLPRRCVSPRGRCPTSIVRPARELPPLCSRCCNLYSTNQRPLHTNIKSSQITCAHVICRRLLPSVVAAAL